MSLRTGDQAASFTLPHKPGESVDLSKSIGSRPVVLLFFPLAFSSVCTDEMCQMRDQWGQWQTLDAAVYGITCDSPFITEKFQQELSIPFPILSDFNREMAAAYGALHGDLKGLKNVPKRSAFVVGADGIIRYAWVSDDPSKMPDFDAIRTAVTDATAPSVS